MTDILDRIKKAHEYRENVRWCLQGHIKETYTIVTEDDIRAVIAEIEGLRADKDMLLVRCQRAQDLCDQALSKAEKYQRMLLGR